jgi:hypothetical protein
MDVSAEFDEHVAAWHRADTDVAVHEWLGLTAEEYAFIVEKPAWIKAVLMARTSGVPLEKAVVAANDAAVSFAARDIPQSDIPKIHAWLKETGRL